MDEKIRAILFKNGRMFLKIHIREAPWVLVREYAAETNKITEKAALFYEECLNYKFRIESESNVAPVLKDMRQRIDNACSSHIWECDDIFDTHFVEEARKTTADYYAGHGIWRAQDLGKKRSPVFSQSLETALKEIEAEAEMLCSQWSQELKASGYQKMDSCSDSVVFPGYVVSRKGNCVYLAEAACRHEHAGFWINLQRGRFYEFSDAPYGLHYILSDGMNAHTTPEMKEYIWNHVAFQASGIEKQCFFTE